MAAKCASKTLFVGNLHASLEETDLLEIFRPFGRIVECCKRWCHYGFIQFATEDEARLAFNNLNGSRVRGRPMRIEFQRKKIRNLAALLEAEAQSKQQNGSSTTTTTDERGSPALIEDVENISPSTPLSYAQLFNSKPFMETAKRDENVKYSTFDIDLFTKQLSFLDSDSSSSSSSSNSILYGRKITSQQPLGTRNLNVSSKKPSNDGSFSKQIASNVLTNQKKPIVKPEIDIDAKSSAWFNYIIDKASKYPTKQIESTGFSLSSSPLSPNHQKSSIETSMSSQSVILYRSLNTSNTIFVQPTDILEPLEIGDFNEYKLFPTATLTMSSPKEIELTPPSSVSLSPASSICSSSSTSPISARKFIRNLAKC